MEVKYSINGKYFKDFGVFVSKSIGIVDALKRKPVKSYDWAEYHGASVDLSKPIFEARNIELSCWIKGDDWDIMYSQFLAFIAEFRSPNTQRLLIEPFGLKPLPYEVYLADEVKIEKVFREGNMVGDFTLKLIEPNPLKIVLYTTETTLNLSYYSPKETEIFYGNGTKDVVGGNASLIGKTLAYRSVSGYAFESRNLLRGTNNGAGWQFPTDGKQSNIYKSTITLYDNYYNKFSSPAIYGVGGDVFTISWDGADVPNNNYHIQVVSLDEEFDLRFSPNKLGLNMHTFTLGWAMYFTVKIFGTVQGGGNLRLKNLKLERGSNATPYTIAPEDEKYIIIAGNVEEITNLNTNAEVLWEKL